jgi:hypothetical protein
MLSIQRHDSSSLFGAEPYHPPTHGYLKGEHLKCIQTSAYAIAANK